MTSVTFGSDVDVLQDGSSIARWREGMADAR